MQFQTLRNVKVPVIGQGTWEMGGGMNSNHSQDDREIQALKLGVDLDMTLIDTAEMYGAGHAEEIVAKAIKGIRNKIFLATKVSPHNFSYDNVLKAAERSLERLQVDQIDLYQLHWPSRIPIKETMRAMAELLDVGKIKYIGISNFSVEEEEEAQDALAMYSKARIVSNQVEYSLLVRNIEEDLLQHCQKKGVTIIAYEPFDKGALFRIHGKRMKILEEVAAKYKKSIAQIALNWLLSREGVITIPKASNPNHVRENAAASDFKLSKEDVKILDESFE